MITAIALLLCGILDLVTATSGLFWSAVSELRFLCLGSIFIAMLWCRHILGQQGEPSVRHPDHVRDVSNAYKWIVENIHTYGGDPDTIFLMGHSAGGHLISLMALDHTYLQNLKLPHTPIKGVIGLSGVYNLGRLKKQYFARWWYLYPFFGIEQTRELLFSASPLTHVHKTDFNFLLINANFDMHLPKDAKEFGDALQKFGVEVEKHVMKGNHLTSVSEIGAKVDNLSPIILSWLEKELNKIKHTGRLKDMAPLPRNPRNPRYPR